jgi:outer membrane biosynthesis protein TonB
MKTGDQTEVSVLHIQEILSPESLKLEDFEVLSLQAFLFSKNSFKFDIQKDSLVQLLMAGHTSDHQQALVQPAAVQTKAKEDSQKAKPEEIPPKTKPPQPEKAAKDQPAPKPTNAKQPAQDDEREFDDFGDFEDEFG